MLTYYSTYFINSYIIKYIIILVSKHCTGLYTLDISIHYYIIYIIIHYIHYTLLHYIHYIHYRHYTHYIVHCTIHIYSTSCSVYLKVNLYIIR